MTPELYGGKPAREIYLGYVSDGQKPCATRGKPTQLSILKKAALLRLAWPSGTRIRSTLAGM